MKKEWNTRNFDSNVCLPIDIPIILILIILYTIVRSTLIKNIAENLLRKSSLSNADKQKVSQKFFGSLYRLAIYFTFALFGLSYMCGQDWIFKCFEYTLTWKNNVIPTVVFAHYYIEVSYYIASIIFLFYEPRMSDFYQMLSHHICTIILIVFSYHNNFLRYGVSIMILHDLSDPFMELAKLCFYLKYQKIADLLFTVFASVFITTRCLVYPFFVVFPAIYFAFTFGIKWQFVVQITALIFLLVLNLTWSFFIIKMVISFVKKGKVKGDIRADEISDINSTKKDK
ncbi:hypothetical protein EDEG_03564 [Edhazardia aedis USNM 41457]|uniref:TLC domain-containing protein n=1 Tax=Edhazardia aedis (strain USNM 41457) TaxID=1003232 RepID=J9D336_EDHAE|nr:hypothetical protein EDEG_03564 [Edhazardia aedis USNM 41457]|eukprot:EJW01984.1 hypothetical protein EDEG_03564 [Edhazardia aedis USNM 41457]